MGVSPDRRTIARATIFFLCSSTAVCFPFVLSKALWPNGLVAWADHIFWPATGVNVAALLILGRRYWPVILLDVFAPWLLLHQRLDFCVLGSLTNAAEALLAAWMIQRSGWLEDGFGRTRPVVALLLASVIAPLFNTLTFPAYLVLTGAMAAADFWKALGNWNLANGAAMLLIVPFLVAFVRCTWNFSRFQRWEVAIWLAAGLAGGLAAFNAVFSNDGMNFAFLVFPFVLFAAVRYGPHEMAVSLFVVMLTIYMSLALQAERIPAAQMPAIIWFVQAFCWVLSATGLIIAALMAERIRAEEIAGAEQRRSLEALLREERARLDALRYQINPHFLFNALNSIRSTVPQEARISREMVTDLADFLRSTLDHPEGDMTLLNEELRLVEQYLTIEKGRFGEDLRIEIHMDAVLETMQVPVFLIQPLVENAIRHGFAGSRGQFDLKIRASATGQSVRIEVANTGVWKDNGNRKGTGLENIRRRLDLLYRGAAKLDWSATDGWVRFQVELPAGA